MWHNFCHNEQVRVNYKLFDLRYWYYIFPYKTAPLFIILIDMTLKMLLNVLERKRLYSQVAKYCISLVSLDKYVKRKSTNKCMLKRGENNAWDRGVAILLAELHASTSSQL